MRWLVDHIGPILGAALTAYAIVTGIFLILENRRPQATLAWMLDLLLRTRNRAAGLFSVRQGPEGLQQAEQAPAAGSRGECPSRFAHPVASGRGDHAARRRERQPPKIDDAREAQLAFRADKAQPREIQQERRSSIRA